MSEWSLREKENFDYVEKTWKSIQGLELRKLRSNGGNLPCASFPKELKEHELSKLLSNHDFSASFPKELKELLSKVDDIFGELKDLKKYVHELEI
nr:hypothetical protein [Tanacetum cinerariifolium]